jgi:hypothetical protein
LVGFCNQKKKTLVGFNWEVLVETVMNSTSNRKLIISTVKKRRLDEEARRNKCSMIDTHTQSIAIIIRS